LNNVLIIRQGVNAALMIADCASVVVNFVVELDVVVVAAVVEFGDACLRFDMFVKQPEFGYYEKLFS
jgi:hypothetical protein